MSRRGRAIHRTDLTAHALIAAAQQMGWKYAPQDGTIDGTLWQPSTGRVVLVDWKSAGGDLTAAQARLVAHGWPVAFISDLDQLKALVTR